MCYDVSKLCNSFYIFNNNTNNTDRSHELKQGTDLQVDLVKETLTK